MSAANPNQPRKSLLRNLGEFFGHVAYGIKSDPNAPKPANPAEKAGSTPVPPGAPDAIVRRETHEREVATPEGKLILRRTVIDEVHRADDRT